LLLSGTGIPTDVIVETPEKFAILKKNKFMIYYNIEEDGRLIYEQ